MNPLLCSPVVAVNLFLGVLFIAATSGCALDADDLAEVSVLTYPVLEGSAQATGVLEFLNAESTTLYVLDYEVPLDKRAAGNLIAHRDGGDRLFASSDDDLFDSLAEVDAVRWVGKTAIASLAEFADLNGWVPHGEALLGSWDGVEFSVDEADWTVNLVNTLSHVEMDHGLGLDRRAADSIVAAQPLLSVAQLAGLYYVGRSALSVLKEAAVSGVEADGDLGQQPLDLDGEGTEPVNESSQLCSPQLSATSNASAQRLNTLLQLSTTEDTPWAEVLSLQVAGCNQWWNDSASSQAVTEALWNESFHVGFENLSDTVREVAPFVSGGTRYLSRLGLSLVVIDERIGAEDWAPSDSLLGQELFEARFELITELSLDIAENPSAFIEQRLYLDMSECSEDSIAVIDTRNGSVVLLHEFAGC